MTSNNCKLFVAPIRIAALFYDEIRINWHARSIFWFAKTRFEKERLLFAT